MERVYSKEEVRQAVAEAKRESKIVALVPTMGALHEGHLSLVRAALQRADYVVVSIFVNPTQFAPGEDLDAYPRDMERDLELLAAEGVDIVFTPGVEAMYSVTPSVKVDPGPLALMWEGESRPTHFSGVATVVTKLLNIVRPNVAFFGEKDYQQLIIVRRVVRDLDLPVAIVGCPTIRELDGLAMSSRNAYLSSQQRANAVAISESLNRAAEALARGAVDASGLAEEMFDSLSRVDELELEYAAIVDAKTLEQVDTVDRPARAIVAARVGSTRLIDNISLVPPSGARPVSEGRGEQR